MSKAILARLAGAAALIVAPAADAFVFHLDEFRIVRGIGTVLVDPFSDGAPPPASPNFGSGNLHSYIVGASDFSGRESGGRLQLDAAGAFPSANAAGEPANIAFARAATNVDPGAPFNFGIRWDDTFVVSGRFDLAPIGPHSGYGLQLTDQGFSTGNDRLDLRVQADGGGNVSVNLRRQDFSLGTVTPIESLSFLPPLGADQVELRLRHDSAGNRLVNAEFQFWSGGLPLAQVFQFVNSVELFHGELFTRAGFIGFEAAPVPLPATAWLMLGGLGALVAFRRRRNT